MSASLYDIEIEQGATWSKQLTWKDDSGAPINLTGYLARMQIRKSYSDGSAQISLTSSSGIVLGGSAGTIAITITDELTAALVIDYSQLFMQNGKKALQYWYDLELESAGGVVTRLLQGSAFIYPEVTR